MSDSVSQGFRDRKTSLNKYFKLHFTECCPAAVREHEKGMAGCPLCLPLVVLALSLQPMCWQPLKRCDRLTKEAASNLAFNTGDPWGKTTP